MRFKDVKRLNLVCCVTLILSNLLPVTFSRAESGSINVAVPPEGYPPYILTSQTPATEHSDNVSGIMVEVLREAASRLDIRVNFQLIPEIRSQMMLNAGTIDARPESPKWVDNPKDYLWSEPITTINDVYVYCSKMPNYFESDSDMAGAEIVTHLGYIYPTLEGLFESGQLHRDDRQSEEFMLNAIIQQKQAPRPGLIKATVMDILVARWLINSIPRYQNQFSFSHRIVDSASYHFQFKGENMKAIVEQLNTEIRAMRDSGEIDRITERIMAMEVH